MECSSQLLVHGFIVLLLEPSGASIFVDCRQALAGTVAYCLTIELRGFAGHDRNTSSTVPLGASDVQVASAEAYFSNTTKFSAVRESQRVPTML